MKQYEDSKDLSMSLKAQPCTTQGVKVSAVAVLKSTHDKHGDRAGGQGRGRVCAYRHTSA